MKIPPFKYLNILVCFILLSTGLFLHGCGSTKGPRRGKLSDVMEKASTDYKGERKLPGSKEPEPILPEFIRDSPKERDTQDITKNQDETIKEKKQIKNSSDQDSKSDKKHFFGFSGGTGIIKGEDFYEMTLVNIYHGTYINKRTRFEIFIGGAWAPIPETSELDKSLGDGVFMLNLGIDFKNFLTDHRKFLTPYIIYGAAYKIMYWRYENPVTMADGEAIYNDHMGGYEIHAGLGLRLAQTKRFQIGGEIVSAITLWESYTAEGFDNDVFGPFSTIMFRVTFSML